MTLSALMREQRESLAARPARPGILSRTVRRIRTLSLAPVRRVLLLSVLAVATFLGRHGLVIAGCVAFVLGAAMLSIIAGVFTAGVALFFLEARRR